jgi:hypothetical protein
MTDPEQIVWVLCNHVRTHLEAMVERFGYCRCKRWPYCKCVDPWTDEQTAALTNALNGQAFKPEDIKSILDTNKELNISEQYLLKQVVRHGLICQMLEQCGLTNGLTKTIESAII